MLQFFYSSKKGEGFQSSPIESLGGFQSSTMIQNDYLNNLFPLADFTKHSKDYLMIIIKNNYQKDINLFFYYDFLTENFFDYKFSFVEPFINSEGVREFEKLANRYSAPFYADFSVNFFKIENKKLISNLKKGQLLGIFTQRTLKNNNSSKTDEQLYQDYLNSVNFQSVEDLKLNFSYE